ncbi:hypothetical protein TSMEX_002211 [Taenia solium]|eukprot:TsM_000718500 transcript=TsM_000718500 gene=TsM_000718500
MPTVSQSCRVFGLRRLSEVACTTFLSLPVMKGIVIILPRQDEGAEDLEDCRISAIKGNKSRCSSGEHKTCPPNHTLRDRSSAMGLNRCPVLFMARKRFASLNRHRPLVEAVKKIHAHNNVSMESTEYSDTASPLMEAVCPNGYMGLKNAIYASTFEK